MQTKHTMLLIMSTVCFIVAIVTDGLTAYARAMMTTMSMFAFLIAVIAHYGDKIVQAIEGENQ